MQMPLRLSARRVGVLVVVAGLSIVGLVATALTAQGVGRTAEEELEQRFLIHTSQMTERVSQHMDRYENLVLAAHGLFQASMTVTEREFAEFAAPFQLGDEQKSRYRGLQGLGFISNDAGEARVTLIEPKAANDVALGFDVRSNPPADDALNRAVQTDTIAMTAPLRLVQRPGASDGIVMYLPVRHPDGTLQGWVYTAFRGQEFLDAALLAGVPGIGLQVVDASADNGRRIGVSPTRFEQGDATFTRTIGMNRNGRTWLLQFQRLPSFDPGAATREAELVWLTGIALTLLVVGFLFALERSLARALGLADQTATHLRHKEARHLQVLENLQEVVFTCDREGRWTLLNRAWEELTGKSVRDTLGAPAIELIHEQDRDTYQEAFHALLAGETDWLRIEARIQLPAGVRWIDVRAVLDRDADGDPTGVLGTLEDITERRRSEEALRRSEKQARALARVLDATSDIVWTNEPGGRLSYLNETGRRLLGVDAAVSAHVDELYADGGEQMRTVAIPAALADRVWNGEAMLRVADGSPLPVSQALIAHRDEHGHLEYFSSVLRDISVPKALEAELAHQARHDPLTGLPNRTLLLTHLSQALARARRRHFGTALLFIDLDRFKVVNDSLGHAAGDEVLKITASRLLAEVREGDTVARFGGDEFTVVCEDVASESEAIDLAERLAASVRQPITVRGQEVMLTVSVGVVYDNEGTGDPEALLHNADAAMYRAKEGGKNRWALSEQGPASRAETALELEAALRQAVELGQLRLHYQPIVRMSDRKVTGFEALVRWQHPTRGLLPPADFIPIAEETGLIIPVGRWVLSEACAQTRFWQEQIPGAAALRISVNLSPNQLRDPELAGTVSGILRQTGLSPTSLCLEVTEHALMRDEKSAAETLATLRDRGVDVAIDDFGTGYSSLAHLRQFPVDVLKIDRSFVSGLADGKTDHAIVASILSLAAAMRLSVVAEGAETDLQLHRLEGLGCTLVQGFRLAKPLDAEEATRVLREGLPQASLTC